MSKSFIEEDRKIYLVGFLDPSSEKCLNTTKINDIYNDRQMRVCLTHSCERKVPPQLHSVFRLHMFESYTCKV